MLDTMLGRLARWLRILRFDARYYPKGPDEQLVALTLRDSRVLVTKDRLLTLQCPPVAFYLLHCNVVRDQLLEIARCLSFSSRAGLWEAFAPYVTPGSSLRQNGR